MSLIVDAGPLVTLALPDDKRVEDVEAALHTERGPLVIPAQVTAEVDYLLRERVGVTARRAFLADLASGRFQVFCPDGADYELIYRYNQQYADLDIGLSDLAVVVAAYRHKTQRILTFDQRHFRTIRPVDGGTFVLLPGDATVG